MNFVDFCIPVKNKRSHFEECADQSSQCSNNKRGLKFSIFIKFTKSSCVFMVASYLINHNATSISTALFITLLITWS